MSLKFQAKPDNALTGGGGFRSGTLAKGSQRGFISSAAHCQAGVGQRPANGSISYGQGNNNLLGPGKNPLPASMRVPQAKPAKAKPSASGGSKEGGKIRGKLSMRSAT